MSDSTLNSLAFDFLNKRALFCITAAKIRLLLDYFSIADLLVISERTWTINSGGLECSLFSKRFVNVALNLLPIGLNYLQRQSFNEMFWTMHLYLASSASFVIEFRQFFVRPYVNTQKVLSIQSV